MGVDPLVDWGHVPLLFEVEGTPCVVSPYFLGYKLKLLPPDVSFKAKIHQIPFLLGLCPRPRWGSLQLDLRGHTSKNRERKKRELGRN